MKLDELKHLISATEPGALLVSHRLLNRIWKAEFNVPYLLIKAPHSRCYFFDRQTLFRYVDQDELELEADRLLPAKVIVLIKPTPEELQSYSRDALLLKYWRLIFHAKIHLALDKLRQEGQLTDQEIRQRIDILGATAFREIRSVLQQEHFLLPPEDDIQVYCEFVAVYQELRYFRSNLRATYFPTLQDLPAIDNLVDQDLDARQLFQDSRIAGAPDPVVRTDTSSDESHDYYWKLVHQADSLTKEGNTVRAAVVRTKAARVAPAALTDSTRESALGELQRLTQRMQSALKLNDEQVAEWLQVLPALLDKADQGSWPDEAKLLYDLQQSCVEFEKKTFAVDLVDWAISLGRRPIKRPLAGLQLVRINKHLRSAAKRLSQARISDNARQQLGKLLQEALDQSEERVRERFRPVLNAAFQDVGLVASNPPEEVALRKMVEELLDRLNEFGFITFSDLRDCVARNQLKMPDLYDPHAFWLGDPLVRLDRRLAAMMDGVYRRGEMYLRWLERSSSLFFGTHAGRLLSLHILIPLGAPLLIFWALEETLRKEQYPTLGTENMWGLILLTGVVLWTLMHVPAIRRGLRRSLVWAGQAVRAVCIDLPRWLVAIPWVRRMLRSWPALLLHWYVLKPLIFTGLIWPLWPEGYQRWETALLIFLVVNIIVNSRFGLLLTEAYTEAFALTYHWLRFDFFQGFVRWTLYIFKRLNEGVEYVLYSVDEWLRFRSGESQLTLAARAVLGVLWFPIGYFARLYFLLFIESNLNPFKLAISIVAAKVVYPLLILLNVVPTPESFSSVALGPYLLFPFVAFTLYMSPGVCAFIVWEIMNNWRLFRANRAKKLRPVVLGKHGETVAQYLKPGFHSGTVPRLFAQLRKAEWRAYRTEQWRPARSARQGLKETAHSLQVFLEREFLTLLQLSPTWGQQPVRVGKVELSCTHIRIELCHTNHSQEPLLLQIEERGGWILCGITDTGWLGYMTPLQLLVMSSALAGIYKLMGADFIREQLRAVLHVPPADFDFTYSRLLVWPENRQEEPLAYQLRRHKEVLLPIGKKRGVAQEAALTATTLFYDRQPVTWDRWVECWQRDGLGEAPACLLRYHGWHLLPPSLWPETAESPVQVSRPEETVRVQEVTVMPRHEPIVLRQDHPTDNGQVQPPLEEPTSDHVPEPSLVMDETDEKKAIS